MAGSSSNWFKTPSGKGSAKGRVFISNATIAKVGAAYIIPGSSDLTAAKDAMSHMGDATLQLLSKSSIQPKGQAKAKLPVIAPAQPPPKGWASDPDAQSLIKAQAQAGAMKKAGSSAEADFNAAFLDANEDIVGEQTAAQRSAIQDYQTDGFIDINEDLWGMVPSANRSLRASIAANALMRAVSRTVAPFDMTVTRGAVQESPLYRWAESVGVGAAYINQGFDSSSINPEIGLMHGTDITMRMRIPAGARGAALNAMGGKPRFRDEQEWLIPANGTWVVSGKTVDADGKIEITVDLVDQRDFSGNVIWP
jgi:hypothetical protein